MVPILTLPALADGATAFRDTDAAGSATRRELMARRLKERLFPRNRRECLTGRVEARHGGCCVMQSANR
ncbi:MAG: hypothetical protein ABW047_07100 [Nitrospiraceae bacterium]